MAGQRVHQFAGAQRGGVAGVVDSGQGAVAQGDLGDQPGEVVDGDHGQAVVAAVPAGGDPCGEFGQGRYDPAVPRAQDQSRAQDGGARAAEGGLAGQSASAGRRDRLGGHLVDVDAVVGAAPVDGGGGQVDQARHQAAGGLGGQRVAALLVDPLAAARVGADVGGEVDQRGGAAARAAQGLRLLQVGREPLVVGVARTRRRASSDVADGRAAPSHFGQDGGTDEAGGAGDRDQRPAHAAIGSRQGRTLRRSRICGVAMPGSRKRHIIWIRCGRSTRPVAICENSWVPL